MILAIVNHPSVMEVANFCAAMDTFIDQDGLYHVIHAINIVQFYTTYLTAKSSFYVV